jgi:hypothetical protein
VLAVVTGLPPDYYAIRAHAVNERRRGTDAQAAVAAVPRPHERHPPIALESALHHPPATGSLPHQSRVIK